MDEKYKLVLINIPVIFVIWLLLFISTNALFSTTENFEVSISTYAQFIFIGLPLIVYELLVILLIIFFLKRTEKNSKYMKIALINLVFIPMSFLLWVSFYV